MLRREPGRHIAERKDYRMDGPTLSACPGRGGSVPGAFGASTKWAAYSSEVLAEYVGIDLRGFHALVAE